MLGLHQNDASARATQAFVGGAGNNVGVRHRVGVQTGGYQARIVRHVDHKERTHVFGNLGKAFKINSKRVGAGTGYDQFWFAFMGLALHRIVVNFLFVVQAVGHHVEPFAAHIESHPMRQVAAFSQTHAHQGVARFQKCQKHRFVGRGTAMRLHIGGFGAKNLLDTIECQLFGNINKFTAAVVAFARIAFGIFVGQLGTLRGHHSGRGVVFAGDQFNVILLALVFRLDSCKQLGVGLLDENISVEHGSPMRHWACETRCIFCCMRPGLPRRTAKHLSRLDWVARSLVVDPTSALPSPRGRMPIASCVPSEF
ncbi:hypothetical protein GALL_550350 [mine drainage metagenome]|uniref:Uncharacterized protein n=1 Tax=mine drainage metagenome TaxID=410659 RepID=A0A1J5NYW1_9ZZZZ